VALTDHVDETVVRTRELLGDGESDGLLKNAKVAFDNGNGNRQAIADANSKGLIQSIFEKIDEFSGGYEPDGTTINLVDEKLHAIPMVGDTGEGGAAGTTPAPAAGDAAAGKVLTAGAAWGTPWTAGFTATGPIIDLAYSTKTVLVDDEDYTVEDFCGCVAYQALSARRIVTLPDPSGHHRRVRVVCCCASATEHAGKWPIKVVTAAGTIAGYALMTIHEAGGDIEFESDGDATWKLVGGIARWLGNEKYRFTVDLPPTASAFSEDDNFLGMTGDSTPGDGLDAKWTLQTHATSKITSAVVAPGEWLGTYERSGSANSAKLEGITQHIDESALEFHCCIAFNGCYFGSGGNYPKFGMVIGDSSGRSGKAWFWGVAFSANGAELNLLSYATNWDTAPTRTWYHILSSFSNLYLGWRYYSSGGNWYHQFLISWDGRRWATGAIDQIATGGVVADIIGVVGENRQPSGATNNDPISGTLRWFRRIV
jgi:hypothetical protein